MLFTKDQMRTKNKETTANKALAKCGIKCKVELLCLLNRQKPILLAF